MFHLDEISGLVTLSADTCMQEAEQELRESGYTLGFFYPPDNRVKVREVIDHALPNLYALVYGELNELCSVLEFKRTGSVVVQTSLAPRQAAGPNWKNLFIGTQGRLGQLLFAMFKLFPLPELLEQNVLLFSSLEESFQLESDLRKSELLPYAWARLGVPELQEIPIPKLPIRELPKSGGLLVLEWAGTREKLHAMQPAIQKILLKKNKISKELLLKHSKIWSNAIRKRCPEIPWGGITLEISSLKAVEFEKRLLDVLCSNSLPR